MNLREIAMRVLCLASTSVSALALLAGAFVAAQSSSVEWQKSYSVPGRASVYLSTGDASLDVHSCGACSTVKVRVEWKDRKASDFNLSESQNGNQVNFELREKTHMAFHIGLGSWHAPQVTVEVPAQLDLTAKTADGALKIDGVQGNVELHTSDGAVSVDNVSGVVRLTASDGAIHMHNLAGTLESRSSDGPVEISGRLNAVQVHTSDGGLDLTLADGSNLTAPSRVDSSDGSVRIHLPHNLAVDLDVHTSDGSIKTDIPLTMSGYDSGKDSGHNLHGRLNGGTVPLVVHTSDGSVSISAL
jgi:DUF4097 and DUF4098 domain-containing protein YvlB